MNNFYLKIFTLKIGEEKIRYVFFKPQFCTQSVIKFFLIPSYFLFIPKKKAIVFKNGKNSYWCMEFISEYIPKIILRFTILNYYFFTFQIRYNERRSIRPCILIMLYLSHRIHFISEIFFKQWWYIFRQIFLSD